MKTKTIKMKLKDKSYPILVGENIIHALVGQLPKHVSQIIVISDERLLKPRKVLLKSLKSQSAPVQEIPVEAGEKLKSMKALYPLYEKLLKLNADRDVLIIALGGGSVGDAVGFLAATYMRGVRWIGIPTTLLAQVDSSVGGKTGINHEAGKNLIGSFHQPSIVACDVTYLKSLSSRERVSGIGEIIKYSLTFDKKFFKWLESNTPLLIRGNSKALTHAIENSLHWKCQQVSQDVEDRLGIREVLNFGHTFGHALESATKYKVYQHGEAVIWGMRFAVALSCIRGKLSEDKQQRIDELLKSLDVPAIPKSISKQEIFQHMKRDKKAQGQRIRFVLLGDIGHSLSDLHVKSSDLDQAFYALTGREV